MTADDPIQWTESEPTCLCPFSIAECPVHGEFYNDGQPDIRTALAHPEGAERG